jgi:hypothetical protein
MRWAGEKRISSLPSTTRRSTTHGPKTSTPWRGEGRTGLKLADGNIKVRVEGVDRARAVEWKQD